MIYACEHHDAVLAHWRQIDLRGIRLAHVDFHDDLRGLLVDRRREVAYAIGSLARAAAPVDAGNFLAHAVLEGRVRGVRWIHGAVGGRAWDAGIVRYESDLFASRERWRHRLRRGPEFPLAFEELLLDRWDGPRAGEFLSVDWDCFASILTDAAGIGARVESFFTRWADTTPEHTWVAYSPEYSHPSLDAFRDFVERLRRQSGQGLRWLSPDLAEGRLTPTGVRAELPDGAWMRLVLFLRRQGIY